jgi:hypothetical protein
VKIRTLLEARKSLAHAERDLAALLYARRRQQERPEIYDLDKKPDLLRFYQQVWPELSTRSQWENALDDKITWLENYLHELRRWMDKQSSSDPRRSLPKKQQRKLGLLPPL